MEQQIINALTRAFHEPQPAHIKLEKMPNDRYSGLIVWEGFADNDAVERQRRVRQALKDALNGNSTQVGILLVYTPQEIEAMSAA